MLSGFAFLLVEDKAHDDNKYGSFSDLLGRNVFFLYFEAEKIPGNNFDHPACRVFCYFCHEGRLSRFSECLPAVDLNWRILLDSRPSQGIIVYKKGF